MHLDITWFVISKYRLPMVHTLTEIGTKLFGYIYFILL